MTEYIVGGAHMVIPGRGNGKSRPPELLVRCRDCANCATTSDGSGPYCSHWSRRVPWDGYCHLGERSSDGVERSSE